VRPLVLGHLVQLGYARDIAEATEWNGFETVLRVALSGGPQRGAKTNEVPTHAHSKHARRGHVSCFVQRNGHHDAQRKQHHTN